MKRIISFILAAAASLIAFAVTADAAATKEDGVIALLKGLSIMQGNENGDMELDRPVSRAEFAKIAIAASPSKNTVALGLKISPYKDVPYTEWYAPYVRAAVSAGYVKGYLDATYRPQNTVTYEEAVTVMLRILGYADSSFGAAYPYGQIAQAQGLDLLDDVGGEIGTAMTRRQVMYLVYNALGANVTISSSSGTAASRDSGASQNAQGANNYSQPSSQGSSVTTSSGASNYSGSLLGPHECQMTENVDIIAGYAQDTSLGRDKIFTSSGTYTKGEFFDDSCIGMTGTVFVKNSRDIISFVPDEDSDPREYESYFVYSVLANSVVGYRDGGFETISIPDGATVYRNQSPTTYSAVKSGLEMGDTLYVKRTDGGSIDYITYESSTMEGPVKVTSADWLSAIGGNSSTTVMRDGVKSGADSIMTNDIVYYSAPLDMAFAYSNKVTGIYESASPTKDAPVSVKISGREYEVEGVDAFNSLSSSGSFNYGDTVTICIGKDGGAAGVVTMPTASASGAGNTQSGAAAIVGYVTEAGQKLFTDANNREYSSYYITLVTPDGTAGTYETEYNRANFIGSVCSLTLKDGKASIGRVESSADVSGRVSYDSLTLGDYTLSPNVEILDVSQYAYKTIYKRIYPQRIDGLDLSEGQILYCKKDAMNEISELILNDITGDIYTYGIVLSLTGGSNVVDVNGTQQTFASGGKKYTGPVKIFVGDNTGSGASSSESVGITQLEAYPNTASKLTYTTVDIDNVTYRLSDEVVCYEKTIDTPYRKIPIDTAINGDYEIKAYYDKPEAKGGRVRILVCTPRK